MSHQTESKIIRKTAKAILSEGYSIRVHDGVEFATGKTTKITEIMAACFATDITSFIVYDAMNTRAGWVQFIHGNDIDVIHDYTMSLDSIMQPVVDYCDNL